MVYSIWYLKLNSCFFCVFALYTYMYKKGYYHLIAVGTLHSLATDNDIVFSIMMIKISITGIVDPDLVMLA